MAYKSTRGFTLIEMMIVITIMAILVVLTYPSYQQYTRRTQLERARADLSASAQELERYYARNHTFSNFPATKLHKQESSKYFNITVITTADTYQLTAAPLGNTGETRSLVYNSTGGMLLCEVKNGAQNCEPYY